ncbi:putative signal peptide-containing protein [Cryptosporidium canis]|uniref:Signal peptide-containing protein n=1 Tax=Cryptosporidium canis TaxID=195482 RepID=A0A9D5I044_9CRYT|nr:putative signal peptide-containing protein [Cryptosporidium canis]
MEKGPKCNRWFLLSLYFLISFGVCGLVGSFTAILPLLRRACIFSNFCRCDPTTKNYRGDDCLNPDLRDLILFEPFSTDDECNPIGCNLQNVLHVDAWKFGLSVPLIASPIAGTIADIIGPRALGTIGALFVCFGLLIWLLLANIIEILWISKYLLGLSWLFLGIGRVCISYSIVSVSSLFEMQSLVISILGGLIDASILLPLIINWFQPGLNNSATNIGENTHVGERSFIYIYLILSVFSLVSLFFTLPSVTFNKLIPKKKLGEIKQYITCQEDVESGNIVKRDFKELKKATNNEDITITCPTTVQLRARSEVTNVKVKIKCTNSDGVECESSAMCDLKASSAIMGGYSVVCSLAKYRYLLNVDKFRSYSSPSNILNVVNIEIKNSLNSIVDKPIFEQLFSYEYFTFMVLFTFNFWRCSILVSKSEYIVSSILYNKHSTDIDQEILQIMNIYNIVMSLGSIFSVIWGIVTTKYGVNFMIGSITILGCFIHILLICIHSLPFWCIYVYFCAFSAIRSFIFGSLNCFIGDTFGFSNFARLAGTQAFTCFVFFQIMNFLTSQYFERISWSMVNQYLLIPNVFLLTVPIILNHLKARRNN